MPLLLSLLVCTLLTARGVYPFRVRFCFHFRFHFRFYFPTLPLILKVMAAIQDVTQNGMGAIAKYRDDPEILAVIEELKAMF